MKICRFCKKEVSGQERICPYCGYNFQTDTLTPGFVKKSENKQDRQGKKIVGSSVKVFMFWATLIIIGFLIFKYQGKLNNLFLQSKSFFKKDKIREANQPVEFIGVRRIKASKEEFKFQDKKIEGIFYDPKGKSYVIINGQLIGEGKSLGGMFIKKVNERSVEIIQGGKRQVISAKGKILKSN